MIEFISDYYLIIMIIAGFCIFALIGYIIDSTRNKPVKQKDEEETIGVSEIESVPEIVEEPIVETQNEPEQMISEEQEITHDAEDFVLTDQTLVEPIVQAEKVEDNS